MKRLLLLLILIPIYSIGQVTISSNNYNVSIKLDTINVQSFKAKVYSLNGQLLREFILKDNNKINKNTIQTNMNVFINDDGRPTKITTFKLREVTESIGTYILIIEYNEEVLKKLIYISN